MGILVLILAAGWRAYASPETGTGTLTLPQPSPNVGEKAREFTAPTINNKKFSVKDKGIYVVTFWSTLNQDSYQAKDGFADLAERYSTSDVAFGAIYVGDASGEYDKAPYSVIQDSTGRLTSLYNVKRVPRLFVIEDGKVRFVYNDYNEANEELLEDTLDEMLAEDSG
ncbi:hypothetical protein BH23ACT11_BH23ACT11_14930 [soil metagenome]